MTTPSIRVNQTNSAARPTTLTSPFTSPQNKVSRDLFLSATRSSARRLFDGTGRTNLEADHLVQSGKTLYSQKELDQALIDFTAAIADKDKHRAKDLSHAEAYIGAGAVFDVQGRVESALHNYHVGCRLLNALHPNSLLLAGSYVRIALLYEAKGKYKYSDAIKYLLWALKIYKLYAETKAYTAQIHHKLSLLHVKSGNSSMAESHKKQGGEIGSCSLKLFLKGDEVLSEIFGMFTYPTKREQSLSSVATEPSPIKEAILPPLHAACSPIRVMYMDQKVGQSPGRTHDQSIDTQSIPRSKMDMQCSPIRVMRKDQGVGSSHPMMQETSSSPFKLLDIHQKAGSSSTRKQEQSDVQCSPMRFMRKDQGVGSSHPMMQEMSCSPLKLPNIHQKVDFSSNTNQAQKDVQCSPIRVAQTNLSSVIEKLNVYEAGFLERGKNNAAKSLLERCQKVVKGEIPAAELNAYLDAHFEIQDNPIFAGMLTYRLKEIFQEARNALLKR
jgi:hypothetical protein